MVLLPVILCCIQLKVWMQSYFHYHLKIAEYMPAAIHLLLSTINIPRGDCCRVGLLLQKNMQVPFYQNIWVILHTSYGFLNSWCWRKNQHTGIRGQVFAKHGKVDQACQSIWHVDWQGDRVNIKFEGVSAGVPIIPQIGVSASFADTIHGKRIFKCKRVINKCVGRISRCTRRQNRLWVADYACVTKSKLRMCNSDDVN